ncbi:hypothetical protein M0802_014390 [Mischocyttarus mexicanus]|nr:hypothetical protein M0802_014390 [Mischocyttarus mexicanus]
MLCLRSNSTSDSDDSSNIVLVSKRRRIDTLDKSSSKNSIPCNFISSAIRESTCMDSIVDNKKCFPPGHEKYDQCIKFMPIVEHANKVFKLYYEPHKELAIDQSLVGTLCHSSIMQYMPNKKHYRWGIKFWMLCDAVSEYCLGFTVIRALKEKLIILSHENKDLDMK